MKLAQKASSILLKQSPICIWLTGMSGAGKSTLANILKAYLDQDHVISIIIDGDELRNTLNKNLGFTDQDRMENVRSAAEIAKLLLKNRLVVICSFMSPLASMRDCAKEIIGEQQFMEVYVKASIENCIERDVKGLYKRFNNGDIKGMSGIDAIYQEPLHPSLTIDTNHFTPEEAGEILYQFAIRKIHHH